MVQGVKSKYFGCYWDSMFLTAMIYPKKIDKKNKEHLLKKKYFKEYYNSFKYIIPCSFCRDFIKDILEKELPINYNGRIELMKSIYLWKDRVNKKLLDKDCSFTKKSPPFYVILKKYEKLRAKCDKKVGKCI